MKTIKIGIVGVSGYSGRELLVLLSRHPNAEIAYVATSADGKTKHQLWPDFIEAIPNIEVVQHTTEAAISKKLDCIFLATPHGVSQKIAPDLLKAGMRVIDLSGDYRLDNATDFEQWYGFEHTNPELLNEAVYGLSEIYSEQIRSAKLLANPGCYPTASLLGIAPIARIVKSVSVDAKSGVSGAGVKSAEKLLNDNKDSFKAYKILKHQHTPEISKITSQLANKHIKVAFVPHLLPIERGILATIYATLTEKTTQLELQDKYKDFYRDKKFVQILAEGESQNLIDVVGTNSAQISVNYDVDTNLAVIVVTIDNLIKGASGQAVQNMNLMFGFDETIALKYLA